MGIFNEIKVLGRVAKNIAKFCVNGDLPNVKPENKIHKGLFGIVKKIPETIHNQTVFSDSKFYEVDWMPDLCVPNMGDILVRTPKEPKAEEYEVAGGAKGELKRNKARYLEIHNPNADKPFNDACESLFTKIYSLYCKPFDWVENKLPRIK